MSISFANFFTQTKATFLGDFHPHLQKMLEEHFHQNHHGRTQEWDKALSQLPQIDIANPLFDQDRIFFTKPHTLDINPLALKKTLLSFKPWRKGPWHYLGIEIQTEWRSDWKWQRIKPHIKPLAGRNVLDIGCGNGYFLYRMIGAGANLAVGVDPTRIFLYQFHCMQRLSPHTPAYILPLRSEHLPKFDGFDTVFCLGVLYHRRSPIEQLQELYSYLREGGEVVLETLIVPGSKDTILVPKDRYAKMANVWFLPSTLALENMMKKVGFKHVRTVDVNQTKVEEQQATKWMDFHSLAQFLDPNDPNQTYEGYPAPRRATLIAQK